MSNRRQHLRRSEAREIFSRFDRNTNGSIDKPEFLELARAIGADMAPEALEVSWGEIDRNGNGRISFDEFFVWWSAE